MIITIDGPAGAGKTTAARLLAARLRIPYLDTGAMYRVVTLAALTDGADLTDEQALAAVADRDDYDLQLAADGIRVLLRGEDVTDRIRTMRVNDHTHFIAASPSVRRHLIDKQRRIAARLGSLVTEGRDQGSAAFPHADMKFFLQADLDTRATRRLAELTNGDRVGLDAVRDNLAQRDRTDSTRPVAPLVRPDDAIDIDTSRLNIDDVVDAMVARLRTAGFIPPQLADGAETA